VIEGFYNYLYLRADDTPYYAGKGKGKRVSNKDHSVLVPPKERRVIMPMISEEEALEYETRLITLFGREDLGTGTLLNKDNGGGNPPKQKWSDPKYRAHQIRKRHEVWQDPSYRQHMVEVHKGVPKPPRDATYCRHISEGKKGKDNGLLGRHSRWHVTRGIVKEGCGLCSQQ
jgi:hypothetical protein